MLSRAMHAQEYAPLKARGLPVRRRLERSAMAAEPGFDDAVATHPLVDAAGNGFYLRQFGHRSILEDRGTADADAEAFRARCEFCRSTGG
jgi:hypothetical protein